MDLECLLFRIHKSILSLTFTKRIVKHTLQIMLAMIFLMLIHFIVLNLNDKTKQSCLDNVGNLICQVEFPKLDQNNTFTNNDTIIAITIGDSEKPILQMKYSKQYSLLLLSDKMVQDHNVSRTPYVIQESCYYSSFVDSLLYTQNNLETLVVGDIMKKMKQVKGWHFLKQYHTLFAWTGEEQSNQETDKSLTIIFKMFRFGLRCFFYIFFQTCYASLIIKIIQFGLPVIMNAGWYRLYQRILINNNKNSPQMIIGYVFMFIVFTQIYQSRTFMTILYYNPAFISIQKEVLLIILFNELMSNLFFRTRSTLYYAPKYIILYYIFFFLYFEGTMYGYYQPLINILWMTCISTILAFLYFYEIPAIQEWNQDSFYTPKLTRPRTFYFPLTQTEWKVDLPQLWTMFYPLYGRRFFEVQNLALVDDNQELLNNYLNNGNGAEQLV